MLRHKDTIRLTASEQATFDAVAGGAGLKGPTSVQEHNTILANAAAHWKQLDTAEGNLLAELAEDLEIKG